MKNPALNVLLIFSLLATIFFFQTLFGGKTYTSPDSQAAAMLSAPLEDYLNEYHEMPLWTPYVFCGMPSFGSLMYAPFIYMPGIIFYPLKYAPALAMIFPVLHFIFAGLGVFVFLQRKQAGFWPGVLGGVAFMFTPYLVAMQAHGHGSQMMTAAYIPWALWAVDRLNGEISLKNVAIAGLLLGFQFQRGHVQISYYICLLVGFYAVFSLIDLLRSNRTRQAVSLYAGMIMAFILAFGLASILYLPIGEYTVYSIRGASSALAATQSDGLDFDYAAQWSFPPIETLTFILPSCFGFGGETYRGGMPFTDYPNYLGVLILLLAVFGLYSCFHDKKLQSFALFSLLAMGMALLLAFGKHFFLYKLFFTYFPYFNKFRVPSMILILLQYFVALWSGFGLQAVFNRITKIKKSVLITSLFIFIATAFSATILREPFAKSNFMLENDIAIRSILLVAAISVLLALINRKISVTVAGISFVILSLFDLWQVDYKIGSIYPRIKEDDRKDAVTAFLQSDTTMYRLYPRRPLFGDSRWAKERIESVGGYHAAKPRLYQDFIEGTHIASGNDNPYLLGAMNAKYMLSLVYPSSELWVPKAFFQYGESQLGLYENKVVQPRAYLVGKYEVQTEAVLVLSRLRNAGESGFSLKDKVLLAEAPGTEPEPDSTATATITKYGLHHVAIKTRSIKPQILVLADSYYPAGWQAYMDAKKVPTLCANYVFRAVSVPGGEHLIDFRFESNAYNSGLAISIMALVVSLALIAFEFKKRSG